MPIFLQQKCATMLNNVAVLLQKVGNYDDAELRYMESLRLRQASANREMSQDIEVIKCGLRRLAEEESALISYMRSRDSENSGMTTPLDLYSLGSCAMEDVPLPSNATYLRDDPVQDDSDIDFDSSQNMLRTSITLQNLGRLSYYQSSAEDPSEKRILCKHTDKSLNFFQLALETAPKGLYIDHALVASICDDIGLVKYSLGQHEDAIASFKLAAKSCRDALDETSVMTVMLTEKRRKEVMHRFADVISHQGRVYLACEQYDQALKCCREALHLRSKITSYDDITVASTLYNIGLVLDKIDRTDEAIEHCQWFINRGTEHLGIDHPNVLRAVHNLGVMQRKSGLLSDAEETLEVCLEHRKALDESDEEDIIDTLNQLGQVKQERGYFSASISLYEEAVMMQSCNIQHNCATDFDEDEQEKRIEILYCMAQAYCSMGEFSQAVETYNKILSTIRSHNQKDQHFYANATAHILLNLGKIQMRIGNISNARASFEEAGRLAPIEGVSAHFGTGLANIITWDQDDSFPAAPAA